MTCLVGILSLRVVERGVVGPSKPFPDRSYYQNTRSTAGVTDQPSLTGGSRAPVSCSVGILSLKVVERGVVGPSKPFQDRSYYQNTQSAAGVRRAVCYLSIYLSDFAAAQQFGYPVIARLWVPSHVPELSYSA